MTENPNTMNDADFEKEKGVWFFGEEKGVRVIWKLEVDRRFLC